MGFHGHGGTPIAGLEWKILLKWMMIEGYPGYPHFRKPPHFCRHRISLTAEWHAAFDETPLRMFLPLERDQL